MRVMTVLGTRPEIIRLSRVIDFLDHHSEHILVHTGQNYDSRLSDIFFSELGIRRPDHVLECRAAGFGAQLAAILPGVESLIVRYRPERLLILGDTNSGLSAIVARRLGVPVYHMEAGNRCFDFRVPEEANRRIIDHVSTILMPYTNRSRENLLHEGIPGESVYVTGNPIKEVLDYYSDIIISSNVLSDLSLEPGRYFLATLHRAENVDSEQRLRQVLDGFARLNAEYELPVVCSVHPRTRAKATQFGLDLEARGIKYIEPLGMPDFVRLEQSAFCLLSDSGTVQEEACIFRVPNVTLRDVTERPETIDCGSNVLAGCNPESILSSVKIATSKTPNWQPPPEYLINNVSETVGKIVLASRPTDC